MIRTDKIEVGKLKEILKHFDDSDTIELYIAESKYEVMAGVTIADDGEEILHVSMLNS